MEGVSEIFFGNVLDFDSVIGVISGEEGVGMIDCENYDWGRMWFVCV